MTRRRTVTSEIASISAAWNGLPVLVIGEAMVDAYVDGAVERVSREAPVPIVGQGQRVDVPGGAANTAVNISALGGRPTFLSVVGDDEAADRLRAALELAGVPSELMYTAPERATIVKERISADGQLLLRLDSGTTTQISGELQESLRRALRSAWIEAAAVIVSDYGYGVLTGTLIDEIGALQRQLPRPLVVDARDLRRYRDVGATAIKPNYAEAVKLLQCPSLTDATERAAQMQRLGRRLLHTVGARMAAVTLDTAGAIVLERHHRAHRTYARPMSQSRATGAGDTYAAALALALATGADAPRSAEVAAAAAAVVVGKPRTAVCSSLELAASLGESGKRVEMDGQLRSLVGLYHGQGRRVVLTSGCFDILHRGHLEYLRRAKALGDVLIVGVNTDESVRVLKGPQRPVNPLSDRVGVLEGLACIDHVVPFGERTPERLIELVRPHIFAKGGDYADRELPEAALVEALGGQVRILPFLPAHSTTRVIHRAFRAGGTRQAASAQR